MIKQMKSRNINFSEMIKLQGMTPVRHQCKQSSELAMNIASSHTSRNRMEITYLQNN